VWVRLSTAHGFKAAAVASVAAWAALPAGPAAVPHRRDQNACFHVDIDRFDDGLIDFEQSSPTLSPFSDVLQEKLLAGFSVWPSKYYRADN
jgi:hypothetical protein